MNGLENSYGFTRCYREGQGWRSVYLVFCDDLQIIDSLTPNWVKTSMETTNYDSTCGERRRNLETPNAPPHLGMTMSFAD